MHRETNAHAKMSQEQIEKHRSNNIHSNMCQEQIERSRQRHVLDRESSDPVTYRRQSQEFHCARAIDVLDFNRQKIIGKYINNNYQHELPVMESKYEHCSANFWYGEAKKCCKSGKIKLENFPEPPQYIKDHLTSTTAEAKNFRSKIRVYNTAFAFTSLGVDYDKSLANQSSGCFTFRIHGAFYLKIGGLLPSRNTKKPAFAQIYIYDEMEEAVDRRLDMLSGLRRESLEKLYELLNEINPFVKLFKSAFRRIRDQQVDENLQLVIRADPSLDSRRYNAPTSSEVAVLIPGDGTEINVGRRDIKIETKQGFLKTISETHVSYDALHYVLLFPYGTNGWHINCKKNGETGTKLTALAFYLYHLQIRDGAYIHSFGRLFHQYDVDQDAKIEKGRLDYVRHNQNQIRAELYQGIKDAISANKTDITQVGKTIVLPASFTGSGRHMQQLFQNAMAIVRELGKPDLFITFTCNPKWPEVCLEKLLEIFV